MGSAVQAYHHSEIILPYAQKNVSHSKGEAESANPNVWGLMRTLVQSVEHHCQVSQLALIQWVLDREVVLTSNGMAALRRLRESKILPSKMIENVIGAPLESNAKEPAASLAPYWCSTEGSMMPSWQWPIRHAAHEVVQITHRGRC